MAEKHGYIVQIIGYFKTDDEALSAEIELIASYRSLFAPLVNLTNGGEGVSGHKQSKEHIEKLVATRKGRKHSEEAKKKISEAGKGRIVTVAQREMMRERALKQKRNKLSDDHKQKLKASRTGKANSPEHREKIRMAKLGHSVSQETREKISQTLKNRKLDVGRDILSGRFTS